MPKVSIIIPTHNRAQYLPEAINSVRDQKHSDYEIIIVDDGSTDNTRDVVNAYKKENPGTISYIYKKNGGPAKARNAGIREAIGKYIAFLDSDDIWLPNKLSKSINFIEEYDYDWVCTASYRTSEMIAGCRKREARFIQKDYLDDSGRNINLLKSGLFFFSDLPLYLQSIVVRKKCFEKAGFFDESFMIGEDTDMLLRLEEAGFKGGYIDEPLFMYRVCENNITKKNRLFGLDEHARLAKKHAVILGIKRPMIRKTYSDFLWKVAALCYAKNAKLKCAKYAALSMKIYPDVSRISQLIKYGLRSIL